MAGFIDALGKKYESRGDISLVIIAHGENPDVVNRASHSILPKVKIHSLIYFQPTIYETYLSATGIQENKDWHSKPGRFGKLYNLYTKAYVMHLYNPIYAERKYRQQAEFKNNQLIMPIKNVRMFKIAQKQLENYDNEDFFSVKALKNLPALLDQIDEYQLNFDLLALGFSKDNSVYPLVAINRFIKFNKTSIIADYKVAPFEGGYDVKTMLPEVTMSALKQEFSDEFRRSKNVFGKIIQLPASKGWIKQLSSEFDEIKRRYQQVESSNILLPPPVPAREESAFAPQNLSRPTKKRSRDFLQKKNGANAPTSTI